MAVRGRRRASNWVPIGSFVAALLMAVLVLPTLLRQSPPQTNQTEQLSPDAPPNSQQSLIAALNRGSTYTAGAGAGPGVGQGIGKGPGGPGGSTTTTTAPPPKPQQVASAPPVPSYCPYGYGTPQRQTFSVYSVGCAPAWSGDNGGSTAPGVTATQVNFIVYGGVSQGPVDSDCTSNVSTQLYCDWEQWINTRYQLYGRSLRVYGCCSSGGTDPATAQAAAIEARTRYNAFAAYDGIQLNPTLTPASVGQHIVTWTFYRPDSFFSQSAPYAWSFEDANDRAMDLGGELVCKQLAGKPPSFNQHMDPTFDYTKPRVFGAVVMEQGGDTANEDLMKQALASCGVQLKVVIPYNYGGEGTNNIAYAMTEMKAEGVTTVLDFADQEVTSTMASTATTQDYYPEWVAYGTFNLQANNFVQGVDQTQWRHAIGFFFDEIPRPPSEMDWYLAACEVDPNCQNLGAGFNGGDGPNLTEQDFTTLLDTANAIQLAGPHLTPLTLEHALQTIQRPPDPSWSDGGSFQSPDPWSFEKYASLVWWNPNATDPDTGNAGAWEYINNGQRYTTGQVPTAPQPFFQPAGSITAAPNTSSS